MDINNGLGKLLIALATTAGTTGFVMSGRFCISIFGCNNSNNDGLVNPIKASNSPSASPSISSSIAPTQLPNSHSTTDKLSTNHSFLSKSLCLANDKTFVFAETNNFFIRICGDNNPSSYIGVDKRSGETIHLLLSNNQGDKFTAKHGNFTYTITNQFLIVTEGSKILRKESIYIKQN
jgi:hypothetical protein